MKCPYCEKETEKGYIHCNDGLKKLYWTSNEDSKKKQVQSWKQSFLINKMENVFLCEECHIIIKNILEEDKE